MHAATTPLSSLTPTAARRPIVWRSCNTNWRKGATAVHHGKLMHYVPQQGTYVYFRYNGAQKVMVVLNKNTSATTIDTTRFAEMLGPRAWGRDVIDQTRHALGQSLQVPARSAMVLEVRQ